MPLKDGYGVLVGTLHKYFCDRAVSDRNYYHCNIKVRAGKTVYLCPVDLDSKKDADGMQWRVVELKPDDFEPVSDFREGWHDLDPVPGSGALDYYRDGKLRPTGTCISFKDSHEKQKGSDEKGVPCEAWKHGTGIEAFTDLEALLGQAEKLFIFGEAFRNGKGVHNIHQNQGDPPGSRWHPENGIWQDGAVVVLRADKTAAAFLCKFKTQHFFPEPPSFR
ncbi:MAG: YukJ family protein [Chlorobiaceae bacterium]|jgi:hypothetical protein|nr:YukJ family protein [Chlorobiaceae bacterium]